MNIACITHPACLLHDTGPTHPESPARLQAIENALVATQLNALLTRREAAPATDAQLLRVHSAAHLQRLAAAQPNSGLHWLDPDTALGPHSLRAARFAAGACLQGIDLLLNTAEAAVFCAVRPPGHHAERDRAMGFCLFNNIAVAAAHALACGLERVAIADFDVHHGNGTEAIFLNDPRVLYCSVFQHPAYPYCNPDSTRAHIVKVPLPPGSDGRVLRAAIEQHWLPILDAFAPELLLISAGFDGHAEDPLAQWYLSEDDYAWVTLKLKEIAERHARGRILSTLEGGYALDALGRSVVAHLRALLV